MKQGTISVLFGIHSMVHSYYVWRSWRKLYHEYPKPWETVCILLHDVGHIGRNYLDDITEKNKHWRLGAEIADCLFGKKGYCMIAGHDASSNFPKSKLYYADKYSLYLTPIWILCYNYLLEPTARCGMGIYKQAKWLHEAARHNVNSGEYKPNHDFYLELKQKSR